LANEVPTTVYQTLGQDSTAIVTQYINTDYVAESGITTTTDELIDIVITALTDQDTAIFQQDVYLTIQLTLKQVSIEKHYLSLFQQKLH
jgi:hypothetical protein